MRTLAHRSAQAAREIKALIADSVERVGAGAQIVTGIERTMEEIVGSIRRVSGIVGEITTASSEQSEGIGQVNAAVSELDRNDAAEREPGRAERTRRQEPAGPGRAVAGIGAGVQGPG